MEKRGGSGMKNYNLLLYTFRTNPFNERLEERFPGLFVFGKLNEDFEEFSRRIIEGKPNLIVGCAKSNKSCFEKITVNQFNKGKIIKNGNKIFELLVPSSGLFKPSLRPATSFCNWTMYKISCLISESNLDSKLCFIHFKKEDYPNLIKSIELLK
jgi:hypothetical protein